MMRKKIDGFDRYEIDQSGNVFSMVTRVELKMKPFSNRKGYLHVSLWDNNLKRKDCSVHRLVAIAFIYNCDPGRKKQVNHIDGNKKNNSIENLEWCTNKENQAHALRTGLRKTGIDNKSNMFSDDDITGIKKLFDNGMSIRGIARELNVNHKTISMILKGAIYANSSIEKNNSNLNRCKFNDLQINKMKAMRKNGASFRAIAREYKTTHSTVKRYV